MSARLHRLFPLFLFLIAFVPRAVYPVSRPLVWYLRSARFINSVMAADWGHTLYSEHPGVSVMWPSGIGLKLYWTLSGMTPAAEGVPSTIDPIQFNGPVPVAEIAAGVVPLALLIALGVVAAYALLRRLFDETIATVAGLLLALSPYYLAESKIFHPEALLATLILLAGLTAIVYAREQKRRWLVLGGLLTGLGFLSKPTSLFILPYTLMILGFYTLPAAYHRLRERGWGTAIAHVLRRVALPLILWTLIAILCFVALWPMMWVDPVKGLDAIKWGLTHHTSTPHDTPTFFRGEITTADPGISFYLFTILFKLSSVELIFLVLLPVLTLMCFLREWPHLIQRRTPPETAVLTILFLALAFFFTLQMSLGAKKIGRYVLPSMLALDLVVAIAIVSWARGLAQRASPQRRRLVEVIGITVPLLVQALLVWPRHPHYGTAYNWLMGGPQAAAHTFLTGIEGEGLDQVAAHLNRRDDVQQMTVAAQLPHVFSQYFQGRTVDIDQSADYVLFHRNYVVRDYKSKEWSDLWERHNPRRPELQIDFDDLSYAWLYPALTPDNRPEHLFSATLSETIHLDGYDLTQDSLSPGDSFSLVLYWRADQPIGADFSVFAHLLDAGGQLVTQDDSGPAHGQRPTYSWSPGEIIADPHTFTLPLQSPSGEYRLAVGLYNWQTGERLPVVVDGEASEPVDHVNLAKLTVAPPADTPALTWILRLLAGSIVAAAVWSAWSRKATCTS